METIDLGKVAYTHKGEYQAETQYEKFDVVTYDGSSFVSSHDENTGNTPTLEENEHWKLLAKRSDSQDGSLVLTEVSEVTDLTSLPIANYSIKATLSANFEGAMAFADTPAEGMEYMIDVLNNSDADITVKLPNGENWQCDAEQISISTKKITSISVRYVHGKYVVLTRSF